MEKIDEQKEKGICKEGLQIESCRQCIFEVLCRLKKFNS